MSVGHAQLEHKQDDCAQQQTSPMSTGYVDRVERACCRPLHPCSLWNGLNSNLRAECGPFALVPPQYKRAGNVNA